MVEARKNSFEFLGYDFMIDEELKVWLIEVNSSPSMDHSTHVTERLVKMVLSDLPKVILDYPKARKKKDCDTGGFILCHKNKIMVEKPVNANRLNLGIEGKKITK
jgi:tubulin monoglycylase TTLL3/8